MTQTHEDTVPAAEALCQAASGAVYRNERLSDNISPDHPVFAENVPYPFSPIIIVRILERQPIVPRTHDHITVPGIAEGDDNRPNRSP